MSKFLSGRLRQLLVGITGYTENKTVIQTTGKVGIGTTDAQQHSLFVVGSTNITGDTIVGGGLTAVGIGSFQSDVYIDQELYVGGVNITGGASIGEDVTTRNLKVSGISTFVGIATAESTLFAAELSVAGISTFENNIDANGDLDVDGHTDLDNVSISGVTTTTGLLDANGGLTANQATVEDLTNDRIVVAGVGGRLEDSANLTFDGSRLEVVGHAELDDVNVSGTATITSLDVLTEFDVYDTQAVFHNNLYIAGNLSIGGTTTTLNAQDLQIFDKDIILGVTTDAFGNDISTDTTANHGGIAIASTEGSPLVPFFLAGVNEDIPDTYKQLMWVKANSYGFGTTDAWLFNYAVGIGSTLVPNGVRFAVSEIQFTDDTINTPNINVAENVNVTGDLDVNGHTELDNLNVSGVSTFVGIVTNQSTIFGTQLSISGVSTFSGAVDINGGLTANIATVEDLTDNRVVISGPGGRLEDDGNLTFDGSNLTVGVGLDVDGHTDLDNVSISGVTTTTGLLDANGGLTANQATVEDLTDNRVVIAGTGGRLEDSANLTFDGTTLNVVGQTDVDDLNVSGLSTFVGITTNQSTLFANQLSVAGVSTFVGNVTFQSNGYFGDGDTLYFGNSYDLQIYHTTAGGGLNYIRDSASGLRVTSDNFEVYSSNLFEKLIGATYNGSVDLYFDGIKRLETTGYGVTVYNTLQAPQLNITGIASVGTAITMYGATGIVSAISFYGDGSNLTNTGATLGATSGTERLVTTQLTSGTMVNAATDADLTYNATTDLLSTPNLAVSGGISTDGVNTGGPQYILRADGSGGWEWASVPGIFSVNNILNGFIVQEEGVVVGTAGSITAIDFRGVNIVATADPQPNGIATVRLSETPTFQTLNVSGITTLGVTTASQLQVTGISTFVGVATFQSDLYVGGDLYVQNDLVFDEFTARNAVLTENLYVAGLSTFVGVSTAESTFFTNQLSVAGVSSYFGDLNFGSNVDLKLASNGTIRTPNLHSNGTDLTIRGGGNTSVRPGIVIPNSTSNNLEIQGPSSGTGDIVIDSRGSGEVIIKDGGVQRFTTNNNGVDITGHTELDELNVSGVSTFVGTINAVDAIFTGNVTIGGTLTYEDVTNIDSIGIITARSDVRVGGNFSSVGITTLASAGGITTTGGDLYVGGNLYADGNLVYNDSSAINLNITGIATFGGQISAGGTTGTDGQYLKSTGVGVTWASFPTLRTTQTTVATDGQTTFNFAYNVNFLDVFINGIKLTSSEYTATSGTQIILASPAFGGDIVEFHSYNTTSTGGSGGGGASILNDLSDVTIGSLSNNQILQYNSGSSVWENVTVSYATEAFVGLSTSGLASESYVGLATAGLASEAYVGLATAGLASETYVGLATAGLASEAFVGLSTAGLASEAFVGLATAGLLSSVIGEANVYIGDNPPGIGTVSGDLWWESTTAKGHIYYDDGSSAQWVEFSPAGGGGSVGSGISFTDLSVTTASAGNASLTYNNTNGVFTYTPPDVTGFSTTTSRFVASNSTGSIGAGTTADITITGAKTYSLLKIDTSHAAWVRIYTDTTSRTNDATRAYTTDPTPGSGVLAEVYTTTTGSNTFKMTPGVVGWNDDGTPSTNIYAKVTNNESGAADITVSLTIVRMED